MKPKILFIFIDGIGIGEATDSNPFHRLNRSIFPFFGTNIQPSSLPFMGHFCSIDPLLDVDGEPQSATGQTTLFTGVNAAKHIGRHYPAFPGKDLRKLIYEENLFKKLKKLQANPWFINAYPGHSELFEKKKIELCPDGKLIQDKAESKGLYRHVSVTTTMVLSNKMVPFGTKQLKEGTAIYQDFSNKQIKQKGSDIPVISPLTAAKNLTRSTEKFDFTLYEYFQTDIFGHKKSFEECVKVLSDLAQFIESILEFMDHKKLTLIITSDHGNIEDYNSKGHTFNAVPFMAWGPFSKQLVEKVKKLEDVTPSILSLFTNGMSSSVS